MEINYLIGYNATKERQMLNVLNDIRFASDERKAQGIHYTPTILSNFVARKILEEGKKLLKTSSFIRIFDPATGDGELLKALSEQLIERGINNFEIHGFDINSAAIDVSIKRLTEFSNKQIYLSQQDFLRHVLDKYSVHQDLFNKHIDSLKFDFIISNPPYVRTQHLGAERAQEIAKDFDLKGRVDLYQPFIVGISRVLKPEGIAGIIVSNRLLTTRSGASIRNRILEEFDILHVWDMGDTKFFEAAVLPAVIFLRKKAKNSAVMNNSRFSSVYVCQSKESVQKYPSLVEALKHTGLVETDDQKYLIKHGSLDIEECVKQQGVWRLSNDFSKKWLSVVEQNTFCKFGDIGKIRVGVKTTADKVFINSDWNGMAEGLPELLRPLTTHHIARRFRPLEGNTFRILYTHEKRNGIRRPVDIEKYPNASNYLNKFKTLLSSRSYINEAGRKWFEIWVPHDPELWAKDKVVFRDIVEKPTFWIDTEKTVVNGDCYWFTNEKGVASDMLWLAMAVANSTFIEFYYDQMFNNKLYSNKRRFMTQYVEKFPLPNPDTNLSKDIVHRAKEAFSKKESSEMENVANKIDCLIWSAFGLNREEVTG